AGLHSIIQKPLCSCRELSGHRLSDQCRTRRPRSKRHTTETSNKPTHDGSCCPDSPNQRTKTHRDLAHNNKDRAKCHRETNRTNNELLPNRRQINEPANQSAHKADDLLQCDSQMLANSPSKLRSLLRT